MKNLIKINTLKKNIILQELGLILLMFVVTVLMFSALAFAFERDGVKNEKDQDWSFYDCIWWGLMTLTTVGYHQQPRYSNNSRY